MKRSYFFRKELIQPYREDVKERSAKQSYLKEGGIENQMKFLDKNTIQLGRVKTELDVFAFKFCKILEKHAKYVVISGYVAILFGRARGSEDVDVFVEELGQVRFYALFKELRKAGFECISAGMKTAFENLKDNIAVRFAEKDQFIPNMELKFAKKLLDKTSLANHLKIITPFGHIYTSNIEQQIAFKRVCLGSDKDLEDALHLEKVFKGKLDKVKLNRYMRVFRQ